MKARYALLLLAFTVGTAQAAVTIKPTIVNIFTTLSNEVAEGVVLNARLLTYEQEGRTRVCGAAYEMMVDELEGKAMVRRSFSAVFDANSNELRVARRGTLAIGATYFIGVMPDATKRRGFRSPVEEVARVSGDTAPHPEIRACLAQLPPDRIYNALQIYTGEGVGEPFVRIPANMSMSGSDGVLGVFDDRFYARTQSLDPQAQDYLSENGKPIIVDGYLKSRSIYFPDSFYDTVVSYGALKRAFGIKVP